jgi:hypothetical protein
MKLARIVPFVFAALAVTGCVMLEVPDGYVSVESHGNAILTAVAPSGNRLVIRRHENPPEGTLAFWREAVEKELTVGRGYELVESQAVTGRRGPAWETRFRLSRPEGAYGYIVTLRVNGNTVTVAEAGGTEEAVESDLERLRTAMR